jgi:hypothetical protein
MGLPSKSRAGPGRDPDRTPAPATLARREPPRDPGTQAGRWTEGARAGRVPAVEGHFAHETRTLAPYLARPAAHRPLGRFDRHGPRGHRRGAGAAVGDARRRRAGEVPAGGPARTCPRTPHLGPDRRDGMTARPPRRLVGPRCDRRHVEAVSGGAAFGPRHAPARAPWHVARSADRLPRRPGAPHRMPGRTRRRARPPHRGHRGRSARP